jgi:hypothetical protein
MGIVMVWANLFTQLDYGVKIIYTLNIDKD